MSVNAARGRGPGLRLKNARFEVKDVATLSGPPAYDFITAFDSIHAPGAPP
ncbi:hypothetical protein [Candidatus Amarobacter glycogenicus]|uniref:hypothetical protein n=1 Tax=Candidatus Amarobacter glycogenicus TaxID=3140699 RepID=UPI0031CC38FE